MIELSPLARPYAKAVFSAALDIGKQDEAANSRLLNINSFSHKPPQNYKT
jgi:F0F1-type ATP synthase delta subunit